MILLTPMDIHNKEFKRSFRGYNEDEIEEFLDRVVNDYEKLFRDNDKLKEEVDRLKKDAESYKEREKSINDTLLLAQKTAQEVTDNARQSAADMKENTVKECENMRNEASVEAKKLIEEATNKVRAIVAEYDRLVRDKNQFLRKVKLTMESELAVLNQILTELPNPEAEEKTASQVVEVTPQERESLGQVSNEKGAEVESETENKVENQEENQGA
jgi:cell division initiation protein